MGASKNTGCVEIWIRDLEASVKARFEKGWMCRNTISIHRYAHSWCACVECETWMCPTILRCVHPVRKVSIQSGPWGVSIQYMDISSKTWMCLFESCLIPFEIWIFRILPMDMGEILWICRSTSKTHFETSNPFRNTRKFKFWSKYPKRFWHILMFRKIRHSSFSAYFFLNFSFRSILKQYFKWILGMECT